MSDRKLRRATIAGADAYALALWDHLANVEKAIAAIYVEGEPGSSLWDIDVGEWGAN